MAKNNIYLGTLSGKLGDNVWWRTHGQQRVRTYFKKSEYAVSYEAGERQSNFANIKAIYQWLPETWRKASNLYRVGGNPYADFMRQYMMYNQGRDKQGYGIGRFLPVNCILSNGTFGPAPNIKVVQVDSFERDYPNNQTLGVIFTDLEYEEEIRNIGDYTYALMAQYAYLREGDKVHVLIGFTRFLTQPWGQADVVAGFPFPYTQAIDITFTLDKNSTREFDGTTPYWLYAAKAPADEYYHPGFAIASQNLPMDCMENTSMVASVMFERPGNTRQQRFTPANLVFNRSQMYILSANSRATWNDYCAKSFMKE